MSDYTFIRATTERVRGAATGEQNVSIKPEQWDDWLAQHDAEVRKTALNAAADDVPPSTPPLGGELAISEPVRMRFQQWLRAQAGGAG